MLLDSGSALAAAVKASTDFTMSAALRLRPIAVAVSPSLTSKVTSPSPGPG